MSNIHYHVLVADDSQLIRSMIRQAFDNLEQCSVDIHEAANGKEALEFLEKTEIDMVITDMNMPVMGGLEFIETVRGNPIHDDLPVLFITSVTDKETKLQAFALGATDYLTKPFLTPELQSRTLGYLERRRAFRNLQQEIEARNMAEQALHASFETIKAQQAEMEEDLEMAEEVQKQLFTTYTVPSFLKITIRYFPLSHVSGDIYHLREKQGGDFGLFIGDGTGHGVAAALTTIMADMAIKEKEEQSSLPEILVHMNDIFEQHLPDDRFMSAVLANITPQGTLTTANAGHPPLLILPKNGGDIVHLKGKGTLLGLIPSEFLDFDEVVTYELQPGDKGFLFTDGITERKRGDEELFGVDRLCQFLQRHATDKLDLLLSKLLAHLTVFAQGTDPDDDLTVIAFEYLGE